ncbi:MAG: thiol:disulfide interchange protein DsbA/DsbL [Pseudomonadota bacterium]
MAKRHGGAGNQNKKVNRARNLIVGGLGLLVIGVVAYGLLYSTGTIDPSRLDGAPVAGTHYEIIDPPLPRSGRGNITEFFSYGCIHCRNMEPLLEDFTAELPDSVGFDRTPVTFAAPWIVLAQTFHALDAIDALEPNHRRMFAAVHDERRAFGSAEDVADYLARTIDRERFLQAYNSAAVRRALSRGDASSRAAGVASVPTLVVNGRYRINPRLQRADALAVARALATDPPADGGPTAQQDVQAVEG